MASNTRKRKNSPIAENTSNNGDESPATPEKKQKSQMTVAEYDSFLLEKKEGRFKRTGTWGGMNKRVPHECCDSECARKWSPSPTQCLADDYYCPSCVLHHRNNMGRFTDERLQWTANVPNTFYVFSLVDPGARKNGALIKFGRTQNTDALKRYPTSELRQYQMKLLLTLRGKLMTMTRIENWWKEQSEKNSWFVRFSDNTFHGQTECIRVDDDQLEQLIAKSKEAAVTETLL